MTNPSANPAGTTSPGIPAPELSVPRPRLAGRFDTAHPLEMFAFFRRWPCSWYRDVVYTFIFSGAFALAFTAVSLMFVRFRSAEALADLLVANLVISNAIGFLFHFVMRVLRPVFAWLNRQSFAGIVAGYTVFGFIVTQLGFLAVSAIPGFEWLRGKSTGSVQWYAFSAILALVISLVMALAWRATLAAEQQQTDHALALQREAELSREVSLARLRLLQAQIEPHFLFNTHANILSLIDTAPEKASRMLRALDDLLRGTLARTRSDETTLGEEMRMLEGYLSILEIRLAGRLSFGFDVPESLRGFRLPAMLLQPLVENAIRHGIEPKIEGGSVRILARSEAGQVRIEVLDSGMGYMAKAQTGDPATGGVGLDNVRERLRLQFGDSARLEIAAAEPAGTRATLILPAPQGS